MSDVAPTQQRLFADTTAFTIAVSVLYFMAGFQREAGKFFWFMLFSLLTFL